MLSALLLALALQAQPEAPASPEPPPAAASPASDTSDIPHGAPKDDYGFVAWCRGALSGHINLYPSVKGELEQLAIDAETMSESKMKTEAEIAKSKAYWVKELKHRAESDEIMLAAGRDYLKLYTEALNAAEAASATNLKTYGEQQRDAGLRLWLAARGADARQRAEVWASWELPARCEHAANRLRDRSLLLAGVMKPQAPDAPRPAPVDEAAPTPKVGEGALLVTAHPDDGPRAAVVAAPGETHAVDAKPSDLSEAKPSDQPEAKSTDSPAKPDDAPAAAPASSSPSTDATAPAGSAASADAPKP